MEKSKIKSLLFVSGKPSDVNNGWSDVIVTLEGGDDYFFEVTTPQTLVSDMEKCKDNFLRPDYPFLIVRELTPMVIKEALEEFISEREDAFWFKLYHSIPFFTVEDLNFIIERHNKEIQEEEEED